MILHLKLEKNKRNIKIGINKRLGKDGIALDTLINKSETVWEEPEWGFPKGRRNYQENDLTCGLREFEEETGYDKQSVSIIKNLLPFEETFVGSNLKSYKHIYRDLVEHYFFSICQRIVTVFIIIIR